MVHLTLAGMSEDGKRLLLLDAAGTEHTVDVDHRLRAALRGDGSRLGQLEIQMESVLRPRDIQARIRAGETPDSVAQAAQTSVEKIMPYAGPVLAERQHVAERAQRSSVRRRTGAAPDGARTLGEAVETHLRQLNVDPGNVEWDAWRREDGRWTLVGEYASIKRSGTAHFTFDMPGNFVLLDDDDARWLVGEVLDEPIPAARDELGDARLRRLSSIVEDDELPLVNEADSHPLERFVEESAPSAQAAPPTPAPAAPAAQEPATEPAPEAPERTPSEPAVAQDAEPTVETEVRRPAKGRRGRASVPSWDEIMFGGGKPE